MVPAVREPGERAAHDEPAVLEQARPDPERRHDTEAAVPVGVGPAPTSDGDQVAREASPLPHGVLRVGHGERTRSGGREIRHGCPVSRGPGVRDELVAGADPEVRSRDDVPPSVHGQVGVRRDDGVRGVPRRPHEEARGELLPGREPDDAALGRLEPGAQVDVRPAGLEPADHPAAGAVGDLGQDPWAPLDEVELHLGRRDLGVEVQEVVRERQELGEALDPGEPAADERHGEQALALRTPRQARGTVERREQAVSDGDGLLDVLEADRVLCDARDGEDSRHRACGDDHGAVRQPVRRTGPGLHDDRAVRVVDARDRAVDEARPAQVASVRDRCVACLDRARDHLGQERLIGHVRAGVDQDELDLAAPQLAPQVLLELPGHGEPGVAPADDDDPFHHEPPGACGRLSDVPTPPTDPDVVA
mgnify:FL=1